MKFSQERTHSLCFIFPVLWFWKFFSSNLHLKKAKILILSKLFRHQLGEIHKKNNKITLCDTVTTPGETFVKMWDQMNESYLHPFL